MTLGYTDDVASRRLEFPLGPTQLPKELVYLYLIAPIIAAPVLDEEFFLGGWTAKTKSLAANYVPFLLIPLSIHLLYRFVMPKLAPFARSFPARLILHATASAITAAVTAVLIHPLHAYFCSGRLSPGGEQWVATCVVITWTFVLPALLVQDLRNKAAQSERKVLQERQLALSAQLEALQSRTHPHFLFNTMNTIASLIQDDPQLAEETLERLADLLRYALQGSKKQEVPLEQELEMLRDYLEIQRARFGERLQYTLQVPDELHALMLPPMLLQPLVENAVLHGVAQSAEGGTVRITARRETDRVLIEVIDDGPGLGASEHSGTGTGLNDLRARLQLLYGSSGAMHTQNNQQGGLTVQLVLPVGGVG